MTKPFQLLRFVTLTVLALAFAAGAAAQVNRKPVLETVQFKSALVGATLPYSVVLPADYNSSTTRYPVIYLLHGLTGHYRDWLQKTNLADYAAAHRIIIVTPEGNDGWYTDSATVPADKYETYIIRELIPDVDSRFRTIQDRRARAVAGLSMGGYGALKFGVKYPDRFSFVASMSGALGAAAQTNAAQGFAWDFLRPSILSTFGEAENPVRAANDLHKLIRDLPAERLPMLPYLYLDCGTADGFLSTNRDLVSLLLERQIPHEFRQLPGAHNWAYWDMQVREVLRVAALRMPLYLTQSVPSKSINAPHRTPHIASAIDDLLRRTGRTKLDTITG